MVCICLYVHISDEESDKQATVFKTTEDEYRVSIYELEVGKHTYIGKGNELCWNVC